MRLHKVNHKVNHIVRVSLIGNSAIDPPLGHTAVCAALRELFLLKLIFFACLFVYLSCICFSLLLYFINSCHWLLLLSVRFIVILSWRKLKIIRVLSMLVVSTQSDINIT